MTRKTCKNTLIEKIMPMSARWPKALFTWLNLRNFCIKVSYILHLHQNVFPICRWIKCYTDFLRCFSWKLSAVPQRLVVKPFQWGFTGNGYGVTPTAELRSGSQRASLCASGHKTLQASISNPPAVTEVLVLFFLLLFLFFFIRPIFHEVIIL